MATTFKNWLLLNTYRSDGVGEYARAFAKRRAFPESDKGGTDPYYQYTLDICDAKGIPAEEPLSQLLLAWGEWNERRERIEAEVGHYATQAH